MTALFISHAWDYNDDYEGVVSLLNQDPTFLWRDVSVPFTEPISLPPEFPRSYGRIVDELRSRIREADCLLVIGAMYCHHRGWMQTEVEAAQQFRKPIIAIKPLGQERLPQIIHEADEVVGWRTAGIISAIRKLTYKHVSLSQIAGIPVPPPIISPPPTYQDSGLFKGSSLTELASPQFKLPTREADNSLPKKHHRLRML